MQYAGVAPGRAVRGRPLERGWNATTPFPFEDISMAFTPAQLAIGANYTLESYAKNDPIDQISFAHATLDMLVSNKEVSFFGNGIFNEKLFISNDSNYQNYSGADQVTYNERDPNRFAKFQYYSNHEGFWFDEDRLIANGINIADDGVAVPDSTEKEQLVNLFKSSWTALKNGIQEGLALETLQNGSQSAKAVPGLDHIVSTTPGTGDVVGINASTSTYWRNNASMAIASGASPRWTPCGTPASATAARCRPTSAAARPSSTPTRPRLAPPSTGRSSSTSRAAPAWMPRSCKGIELIWDPTFEVLDAKLGAITYPWTKLLPAQPQLHQVPPGEGPLDEEA
ncbi:hypothetical protein SNK04_014385 [Fusarium graminearum]